MTEAEITFQVSEYLNRIWDMQQWWASISIGVLVMAHIASSRLNLFLVCISLGLYTAYTLYMVQMLGENYQSILALLRDLRTLVEAGVVTSSNAGEMLDIENTSSLLYAITYGGTYVSVIAYLIYSYVSSRGS